MTKLGRNNIAIFVLLLGSLVISGRLQGQTQTTGDVAGTITDPSRRGSAWSNGVPEGYQPGQNQRD